MNGKCLNTIASLYRMSAKERESEREMKREQANGWASVKHALQFNWNPIDNILSHIMLLYLIIFSFLFLSLLSGRTFCHLSTHHPSLSFSHFCFDSFVLSPRTESQNAWIHSERYAAAAAVIIWIFLYNTFLLCLVPEPPIECEISLTGGSRCVRQNRNRKVISVRYIYNVCFMCAD